MNHELERGDGSADLRCARRRPSESVPDADAPDADAPAHKSGNSVVIMSSNQPAGR